MVEYTTETLMLKKEKKKTIVPVKKSLSHIITTCNAITVIAMESKCRKRKMYLKLILTTFLRGENTPNIYFNFAYCLFERGRRRDRLPVANAQHYASQ